MAYTPTTWTTGDDITASLLNKMENGIANAGSALIVNTSGSLDTMDATYKEIWDSLEAGVPVYFRLVYGDYTNSYTSTCYLCPVTVAFKYDNTYRIMVNKPVGASATGKSYAYAPAAMIFEASGINSYPTFYTTIYPSSNASIQEQLW